jgi:hypothetical protein
MTIQNTHTGNRDHKASLMQAESYLRWTATGASIVSRSLFGCVLCSLVAVSGCHSTGPSGRWDNVQRRHKDRSAALVALVHRVGHPIVIDGVIGPKEWAGAQELNVSQVYLPARGEALTVKDDAVARFLWDDQFLYFAIEMKDKDVWCSYTQRDSRLPIEDVIEIFLKPSAASDIYYEFEFSPKGVIFDLRWPKRGTRSNHWAKQYNCRCEIVATVHGTLEDFADRDEGWLVEGRIPFADLAPPLNTAPKVGQAWRANVCRYNYGIDILGGREMSTWSPYQDSEHGYHRFEDYGKFMFVE